MAGWMDDVLVTFAQDKYRCVHSWPCFKLAASNLPAASAKPVHARHHPPQARTSPPRLAAAHTLQAVRAAQKFCSAVVRQVARRARQQVCLGACRGWAKRWTVRCSKRRNRGGRSESSGQGIRFSEATGPTFAGVASGVRPIRPLPGRSRRNSRHAPRPRWRCRCLGP